MVGAEERAAIALEFLNQVEGETTRQIAMGKSYDHARTAAEQEVLKRWKEGAQGYPQQIDGMPGGERTV